MQDNVVLPATSHGAGLRRPFSRIQPFRKIRVSGQPFHKMDDRTRGKAFSKAADVYDAVRDDSNSVHRVLVRHGTDKQFAVVLKGNKATVEQVIKGRREQQTIALEQPLVVVRLGRWNSETVDG